MKYRQYKFKFYLNASHAIYIKGKQGQRHPHTWEISINTLKVQDGFIKFEKLESKIEGFLQRYQDTFLNDVKPFDILNPTLENCCEYFKEQIQTILNEEGWLLLMIEMSETPTRSFVINTLEDSQDQGRQTADSMADIFLQKIKEIG